MSNTMTRTAPERIYLQVADGGEDDTPFPASHDDVTWCDVTCVENEVEYVRADLAAEREQEAQVMSALCITLLGKPVGVYGTRESIDALDAYLSNHAAMVVKLRELSVDMANARYSVGVCVSFSDQLDAILAAEPASSVNVDVEAVREVIESLEHTISIPKTAAFNQAKWSAKLSAAIGDKAP